MGKSNKLMWGIPERERRRPQGRVEDEKILAKAGLRL